jgi:hypothetical protein
MSSWNKNITGSDSAAEPLAPYAGTPILGSQGPGAVFLGRVVVEVWQQPGKAGSDPSRGISFSSEAVDGDHRGLLRRVAATLPQRVAKLP